MMRRTRSAFVVLLALSASAGSAQSQRNPLPEAKIRWDRMCQIRHEKFDHILPEAMRENGIDMWIVAQKEGHDDPMATILGGGYTGSVGYFVFTDKGGGRIERAALGITDHHRELCGAYDIPDGDTDLLKIIATRNPKKIGINMSAEMGLADGLTKSVYDQLVRTIGPTYASRLVSAEKMVSDFSSRRTASEIVAFGEAGEMGRQIAERALSNEVITPGMTTLADVAWWIEQQQFERHLGTSFGVPSVYITGPNGIEATSNDRIIQRGDIVMLDFGVGYLSMWTDQKRIAYILKPGEVALPASIQTAFDNAVRVRDVIHRTARPGKTAQQMMDVVNAAIVSAGILQIQGFNKTRPDNSVEFIIGCHSVGDWGHGIGPSMAFFNPGRLTYEMRPGNLFSIELFAYTPIPEWGGKKLRIPLEDDATITGRGVEWVYPVNPRIILVK